jgi:hypothetical protein
LFVPVRLRLRVWSPCACMIVCVHGRVFTFVFLLF